MGNTLSEVKTIKMSQNNEGVIKTIRSDENHKFILLNYQRISKYITKCPLQTMIILISQAV